MAKPFSGRVWRGLWRLLRRAFAVDPGPASLAEEVADRLFDPLTLEERVLLRGRLGVDLETNAALEEFIFTYARRNLALPVWRALAVERRLTGRVSGFWLAAEFAAAHTASRQRIREIEAAALIRLYRWELRKHSLPAVHRRLIQRIAAAHEAILEALCDAPPLRPVLVGWHDQLVDGRREAAEIAEPPAPVAGDDPDSDPQTPEIALAALLRKALWANARARKPVRDPGDVQAVRDGGREAALEALRALRLNSQSIDAVAEALLFHARRLNVESDEMVPQLLDPVADPDAPAAPDSKVLPAEPWQAREPDATALAPPLVDTVTAESGMAPPELRDRAGIVGRALAAARHNRLLLVDSCMPLAAEVAVARGLRGHAFVTRIERDRAILLRLVDRFCFAGPADFAAAAEQTLGESNN